MKNNHPTVKEIFEDPVVYFPLLIRSSKNLQYLKSIPTILRQGDIILHGDTRLTNSNIFQNLLLCGMKGIGLKSKVCQILSDSGILGKSSVSKKKPLKIGRSY